MSLLIQLLPSSHLFGNCEYLHLPVLRPFGCGLRFDLLKDCLRHADLFSPPDPSQ